MLRLPGTTTAPPRAQIAEPDSEQVDGSISPERKAHSELNTFASAPLRRSIATTWPWYGGASPV